MTQKILSLTNKDFLRGYAISPDYEHQGLWDRAEGVDFYRSFGYMRAGYEARTINDTVTGTVEHMVPYGKNLEVYGWDDDNRFYKIFNQEYMGHDVANVRDLAIYQDYLVYPQATQVGVCDLSTLTFTDDAFSPNTLNNYNYHQGVEAPDRYFYIANKDQIDGFNDVTDSSTWVSDVVPIQTDYIVTSLENDGFYLVGSMSRDNTGATVQERESKVFFWDTFSDRINREYTIPDYWIGAIKKVGNWIYALGSKAIYRFTYDNPPEPVLNESFTNVNLGSKYNQVSEWKNTLLFGDVLNGSVYSYGSPLPGLPAILTEPFKTGSAVTGLCVANPDGVYVSKTGTLYRFYQNSSSPTATTALIDLGRSWKITDVKIVTKALLSGDSVQIQVQNESESDILNGTHDTIGETYKVINFGGTAKNITDMIKIKLTLSNDVRIKRIDLFGIPIPLHHG